MLKLYWTTSLSTRQNGEVTNNKIISTDSVNWKVRLLKWQQPSCFLSNEKSTENQVNLFKRFMYEKYSNMESYILSIYKFLFLFSVHRWSWIYEEYVDGYSRNTLSNKKNERSLQCMEILGQEKWIWQKKNKLLALAVLT